MAESSISEKVNTVVNAALDYKGTPYLWGGTSNKGMDCSGLVLTAFKSAGIALHRVAAAQATQGIPVSVNNMRPGDLVFFTDKPGNRKITHVGLISEVNYPLNSITFVHASSSRGVMESELLSNYWKSVFLQVIRPKAFLDLEGNQTV